VGAIVFESPDGRRSSPVDEADHFRRGVLEREGWKAISPDKQAREIAGIKSIRATFAGGSQINLSAFASRLEGAGLAAAFRSLPVDEQVAIVRGEP